MRNSPDKRGIGRYSAEGIAALTIVSAVILYMLWLFVGSYIQSI